MNLYPEVSSGFLGVKRKVTQRQLVLLTIQSIGGFVDLVAKWQEFDYLLGRVDRPSHIHVLPQLQLLHDDTPSRRFQDSHEPISKRLQSSFDTTILCDVRICFEIQEICLQS